MLRETLRGGDMVKWNNKGKIWNTKGGGYKVNRNIKGGGRVKWNTKGKALT